MSDANPARAAGVAVHPSPQQLAAFLAGLLSPEEMDELEPHISSCESCCASLRQLPSDPLTQRLCSTDLGLDHAAEAALAAHPRYRLLEPLGSGGMGTVYKARHLLMDRIVALKVIHHRMLRNPRAVERFHREAKAAARLSHPHIVTAHDADEAGGCHFLVMEFIEGQSLAARVAERGSLSIAEACGYACQAALGLQHAFEHGMVHRDVKPQNLMLTRNGQVKVLDFGLAHFAADSALATPGSGDTSEAIPTAALTHASTVIGTPDYMAPEQIADSRTVDVRTDVYALGCTLYFLLTGRPPFPDGSDRAKLEAHRARPPRPLTEVRPDAPPALAGVVARMLAKVPADRYQCPAEVERDLRPFAGPSPNALRRWRNVVLVAAAVLLLSAIAATMYARTGTGTLALEVSEPGSRVMIDGQHVPFDPPVDEIPVNVGRHTLIVTKDAYTTHAEEFEVPRRGSRVELTARLARAPGAEKPPLPAPMSPPAATLSATVTVDLVTAAKRIEAGLAKTPLDPAVVALRQELMNYRVKHYGTPGSLDASRLMTRLAWPLDELGRNGPPPAASYLAGDGDALSIAPQLVGVFGDGRLMHWSHVNCVAFSPDGQTLASGGVDSRIRIWNPATGEPRHVLQGHKDEVLAIAFSPDGKTLASVGSDGRVFLWDPATGNARASYFHGGWTDSVGFTSGGRIVYSASRDGKLRFWDVTGEDDPTALNLPGIEDEMLCLAVSPAGKTIATGGRDRKVRVWDAAGKKPVILGEHRDAVWALTFSPDGQTLVSGGWDGDVKVWDLDTVRERYKLGHAASVWSVAIDPDGKTLATGDTDYIKLWNLNTGEPRGTIKAHEWIVRGLAFGSGGKTLASASWDGAVKIWDVATAKDCSPHRGPTGFLSDVAVSLDGRSVAASCQDGTVRLWDVFTGEGKVVLRAPDCANGVAISPDGKTLAAACQDGTVRLWNTAWGREGRVLRAGRDTRAVAFGPDGNTIAAVGWDGALWLWDLTAGTARQAPEGHQEQLWTVAFSPDGKTLAAGGDTGAVLVYDTATLKRRYPPCQLGNLPVLSLAFSPDGATMASAGHGLAGTYPSRSLARWVVATGQRLQEHTLMESVQGLNGIRPPFSQKLFKNNPQRPPPVLSLAQATSIQAVAYSPDGKMAATVGDGVVRVWDASTGWERQTIRLAVSRRDIRQVAFAPDGRHIVTANGNGTIFVLRLATLE